MADDRFDHCQSPSACSGRKRGQAHQALGRSRGGLSTKIHVACDSHGNPLRFILTPGQASDFHQAVPLLKGAQTGAVLADKGYDAEYVRKEIESIGAQAVIPPKSNRKIQRFYDKELYKERNIIERMFNKMKHFRRIATR